MLVWLWMIVSAGRRRVSSPTTPRRRLSVQRLVSCLSVCIVATSLIGCGRSYRYNVETEATIEVDGQALTHRVVTECRAHDVPSQYESSIIGLQDSVQERGEPLGVPLPDGRLVILGGVYGCDEPAKQPEPGSKRDALSDIASRGEIQRLRGYGGPSPTYIFDAVRNPSVLEIYDTSRLGSRGGPFVITRAVHTVVDREVTSDLERAFPAAADFGRDEANGARVSTRFAGLQAQRWTAASVEACGHFSPETDEWRVNCSSDDAEDVVLALDEASGAFVVMDSPPAGLTETLYRVGRGAQVQIAPIEWRPTFCIERVCTELALGGSTKVQTPSGVVYEVRRHVLDLKSADFLLGNTRREVFRNEHSLMHGG